ncbi:DUF2798 domain-containing protein [Litoribacillus peritrichatus]|uniref:DUF2798 domain-containing protein n=1 Tax=Litoribacillus peritrichatus TaxID=718191 RepID=A0ABP7M6Q3_9GAMM
MRKKIEKYYFPFFMALFMSGLMSFILMLIHKGIPDNPVMVWLHSWSIAFACAFPSVVLVSPLVHKICAALIKKP